MQDRDEFSSSYDPRSWLGATRPRAVAAARPEASGALAASLNSSNRNFIDNKVPVRRSTALVAGAVWIALLVAGAGAAVLERGENVRPVHTQPVPTPPVLRTVAVEQPREVAEALVAAGMPTREAKRIGRQVSGALRPGDRQIRLTVDTGRSVLVRLEATSADGSKLRLDRDGRH